MKKYILLTLVLFFILLMPFTVSAEDGVSREDFFHLSVSETKPPIVSVEDNMSREVPVNTIGGEKEQLTVSTESNMSRGDSLNISVSEKEQLVLRGNKQVVKQYRCGFCFIFPKTDSIEEVLQKDIWVRYLILKDDKIVSHQRLENGKAIEVEDVHADYQSEEEVLVSKMKAGKNLLTKISTDIEVNNSYYFVDTTYLGSCLYFVTNQGNYVYYRHGGEYLFPVADFVDVITLIAEERDRNPYANGGSVDISDYMNVSKYDMNSPLFGADDEKQDKSDKGVFFEHKSLFWSAWVVGVLIVVGVGIFLGKRVRQEKRPIK